MRRHAILYAVCCDDDSPENAKEKIFFDKLLGVFEDAITGFVSGAPSGAVVTAMGAVEQGAADAQAGRQIAEQGPCVIIGRCADYALAEHPELLSLFIHAPMDVRIQRVAERQDVTPEKARQMIVKTDKRRASYYEYYSAKRWGAIDSYDFCLDSSYLGLSGTVELVRTMVDQRENPIPSPTEIDPTR